MSGEGSLGRLTIKRWHAYGDAIRPYLVVLDGDRVGEILDDSSIELSVSPGQHELYLKIDWCRSPILSIDVRPNEDLELECHPNATFLTLLPMVTLGRKRYIDLRLTRRSASS